MLANYLKTALRNLLRDRLTAFINISGLAISITTVLLIYLFIKDELSFDRYHSKADRIYRVTRNFLDQDGKSTLHLATIAPPFGPLLKNDFGEVNKMARTLQYSLVMAVEENGERKKMATENDVYMAEPALFDIFDIPMVSGVPGSLERPLTVLLSEKAAQKYFGTTEVSGKHLKAGRRLDLEVTGVFRNFPLQSHWHPDFLVAFSTLNDSTIYGRKNLETNYGNNSFCTYLLLDEGADPAKIEARFPDFINKHYGTFAKANFGAPANFVASRTTTLFMQKVTDIHLRSHLDDELEAGGNINNVYTMGAIGVFIILIACFNFINLSTAQATRRAKEVGLRKALGAFRKQLVFQYLSESVMVTGLALILAIALILAALPWLNAFTGKLLRLSISDWQFGVGVLLFSGLVGLAAGAYPAFVLSAFKPAMVLKGKSGSHARSGLRRALVVMQFTISVVLIIATVVTQQQLAYVNKSDLGYDKDRVILLPMYSELNDNYDAFYNELTKSSAIKNLARSSRVPTGRLLDSQGGVSYMQGDSLVNSTNSLKGVVADYEFFDTYNIAFAAGRNFSKSIPTDDSLAFIINEAAVRMIGWKSNDEGLDKDFAYGGIKGKLIGVVKDFHFESLHQPIVPLIFSMDRNNYNALSVKLAGGSLQDGISHLERVWKSFLPIRPFDYQFTSDRYAKLYEAEQKQGKLFVAFAGMAIFIACLGLLGLTTFSTLQRIKEIGVRKVMGASVASLLSLLSQEILVLIALANLLAWPLAWYMMNLWLGSFAYHISITVWVFAGAAMMAFLIALLTVSTQTLKAAMTNPSETLRYE